MERREIPAGEDWTVRAIRLDGEPWWCFASHDTSEYWVLVLEATQLPAAADLGEDQLVAKMAELFGLPWEEVEEDPRGVFEFQSGCENQIGAGLVAKLDGASLDDVRKWRERAGGLERGELMWSQLTGSDAFSARN